MPDSLLAIFAHCMEPVSVQVALKASDAKLGVHYELFDYSNTAYPLVMFESNSLPLIIILKVFCHLL